MLCVYNTIVSTQLLLDNIARAPLLAQRARLAPRRHLVTRSPQPPQTPQHLQAQQNRLKPSSVLPEAYNTPVRATPIRTRL